jgi:two-component system nitrogen regulation sensor histidine kinase NtrY
MERFSDRRLAAGSGLAGDGKTVSFRTRLLVVFTLTVVTAVALVAWTISQSMRSALERLEQQRTAALLTQFRREFARRGEDVTRRVEGIAGADETQRMAVHLARAKPDLSAYVNSAAGLAETHQLNFLEIVAADGTIVSSAQWPARFGYKEDWVTHPAVWSAQGPFLRREDLPEGSALALEAVRDVRTGNHHMYLIGGTRMDREFLASLVLPAGMRALLYREAGPSGSTMSLVDASGPLANPARLMPLIARVERDPREQAATVEWSAEASSAETFHAIPLKGRDGKVLGMFLVGSSRREQAALERRIRLVAMLVGAGGILLAVLLSGWAASRVTRPVASLARAARRVADGDWNARVDIRSGDELGQLAGAFNTMTRQLAEQRDRLVQAERVAAWRELARRLAHELKNPLFPLQITVENLLRSRERPAGEFDEVFRESTRTLLDEIANLRAIVGHFSDFAKMPAPQLQDVDVNELLRGAVRLFEAQVNAAKGGPIYVRMQLAEGLETIRADPDLLHRAVQNLVLNALDAMPEGGTLTLATFKSPEGVCVEVSDTGKGLTTEECARLFTPYYTSKQHGTGLGLAIVQSVVSDHGGTISVESDPGRGTSFRIELPADPRTTVKVNAASESSERREVNQE